MSTDRNDNQIVQIVISIIIIVAVIFLVYVWNFSKSIGADFQVTLSAVWKSIVILIAAIIVWWQFRPRLTVLAAFFLIPLWPLWWSVIDNIANKIQNTDEMMLLQSLPWWTTDWFKYGTFVTIILLWLFLILRKGNDYRG